MWTEVRGRGAGRAVELLWKVYSHEQKVTPSPRVLAEANWLQSAWRLSGHTEQVSMHISSSLFLFREPCFCDVFHHQGADETQADALAERTTIVLGSLVE
jgi:hypothetical protein